MPTIQRAGRRGNTNPLKRRPYQFSGERLVRHDESGEKYEGLYGPGTLPGGGTLLSEPGGFQSANSVDSVRWIEPASRDYRMRRTSAGLYLTLRLL